MKLRDSVRFDKALRIKKGMFVHNCNELLQQLKLMNDTEFHEFLLIDKHSIENWIRENYKDEELFLKLKKSRTRKQYIFFLQNSLKVEKNESITLKPRSLISIILFIIGIIALAWLIQDLSHPEVQSNELTVLLETIYDYESQLRSNEEEILLLKSENRALKNQLEKTHKLIVPTEERIPTPADRIDVSDIVLDSSGFRVEIHNPVAALFANTGSMLPVLSSSATAIQIVPESEEDIRPGDIISYEIESGEIIIHRVLEVGIDYSGWYALAKGDSNPAQDKEKIRFSQIQRVLVAVLY